MSNLTAKQEASLELFMKRLRELFESPIVKNQRKSVGDMSETVFEEQPETTVVFDGFKEDEFVAFYSTFRQFTMEKEQAVYFKDVCQIVLDHCDRDELKDWVSHALRRWDDILDGPPVVGFSLGGESYTNRKLLKLWLYGGRFHTDIDKAETWDLLSEEARRDAELSIQALTPRLVNCLVLLGTVMRLWREPTTEKIPAAPVN